MRSLPTRKWAEEFLAEVRREGKKDKAYEQARKQEAVAEELKDQKARELSWENDVLY